MSGRRLRLGVGLALCVGMLAVLPASASALRVDYRSGAGNSDTTRTFFDHGGLRLIGECDLGTLKVVARSRFDHAMLHANLQRESGSPVATAVNDFNHGSANQYDVGFNMTGGSLDSTAGQMIYTRPGGGNTTVEFMANDVGTVLGGKRCIFTGNARVVESGSSSFVNFRSNASGPPSSPTFFSGGGLSLRAGPSTDCDGTPSPVLDVNARSSTNSSVIGWAGQYTVNGVRADEDTSFDTGMANQQSLTANQLDTFSSNHLVYANLNGSNTSVDWAAQEDDVAFKNCLFVGSARVAPSGSSHRVNFRPVGDRMEQPIFSSGGLTLRASCLSEELQVIAKTSEENSMAHYNSQTPTITNAYAETDDFDPDDEPSILVQLGSDNATSGQFLYSRPNGTNVTIKWAAWEAGDAFGGTKSCAFVGTAEKNTP